MPFANLFSRRRSGAVVESAPCPHTALIPHWDSVEDMGKSEKITSYTCDGCEATFSLQEANRLRAEEARRLRVE